MRALSFWSFWGRCCKKAVERSWGHFNFLRGLGAIVSAICVIRFIADWFRQKGVDMNWWLLVIPVVLFALLFFRNLAKAPYEVYKEDMLLVETENKKLLEEKDSQINQKCDLQIETTLKYGTGRDTRYDISVFNEGPSTADGVKLRIETVCFVPLGKALERIIILQDLGRVGTSCAVGEILPGDESLWHFLHYNDENKAPVWEFNTVQPYTVPIYDPCQNNEYEILVSVNARNAPAKKYARFKLTLLKDRETTVERVKG
jgi:hypothetical protein